MPPIPRLCLRFLFAVLLLQPTLLEAEPVRVAGRILGPGGLQGASGAPGVRIELWPAFVEPGPKPLATALSDAEGFFEVTAPEIGAYRVRVLAEGRPAFEPLPFPLVEDTFLPPIHLNQATLSPLPPASAPAHQTPARTLQGRVVSAATSAPLPNALVWTGDLSSPPARTAADGSFSLPLSTSEKSTLEVAAAGHLRMSVPQPGSPPAGPLVLKLEPAARIPGQAVDEGGRPIPGVWLRVTQMAPKESFTQALTRADGSFQLTGLAFQGSCEIKAFRRGFLPATLRMRTPVPGRPQPPVRLVLRAGRTAFGRIVDEAGAPVAGAEMMVFREPFGTGEVLKARSDAAEGRFEVRALAAGSFALWISREGFALLRRTVEVPAEPKRVDLGVIRLPAGAGIAGQVTDTNGKPVAAATVRTDLGPFRFLKEEPETETDSEGRFHLRLPHGTRVRLSIDHEGYLPLEVSGVEAPVREPLHLELKAVRTLSGWVVGPGGEPVANAYLTQIPAFRIGNNFESSVPQGSTDAQGRFRLSGLEPGPIDLRVNAQGYTTRMLRGLSIPQDQDVDGLEIVLSRWTALRIRVLSPEGDPVVHASLRAEPDPPQIASLGDFEMAGGLAALCSTDEQGTCLAEIREPGTYRVTASMGETKASVLVQAGRGTTPVELRLPLAHKVSGWVTDAKGGELPGVTVRLQGARSTDQTVTREDGSFVLQDVTDGPYELTAKRQGYLQSGGPRNLRVEGGDVQGLEIRLTEGEKGAALTGRLLGLAPEEMARALVQASSAGEPAEEGTGVGADGRYRIGGLPAGDWNVRASVMESGRWLQSFVRIEPGASEVVQDFDFGKGLTLTGRVLVDGAPLAGADVTAAGPDGDRRTQTAYDGRFQIQNLSPGPSLVTVLASRGALGQDQTLEMDGDREMTIDIQTGVLHGQVISEGTGEPLAEATVLIQGVGTGPRAFFSAPTTRSAEDGAFETRLAAGTYQITVQKDGYAPSGATVEVRPGLADAPVEIRLKPVPAPG